MKMMEILRILYNKNEILGAKVISEELEKRGYSLGERAVRYHMHILDEKELTQKVGYKGRKITKKGIEELKKGLIYDQVDFTYSRFQEKMYNVSLEPRTAKGSVIVNISSINNLNSIKKTIDEVYKKGLAISDHYNIINKDDKQYIETVCGTTIDGVFQQKGIITKPLCGGLVKIEDNTPIKFIEQISYTKTSITPLEAFTGQGTTSILDVINTGNGIIPANFRIIPAVKKEEALHILRQLKKIGISGVIAAGEEAQPVLGIPVPEQMIGIAIIGGVTPLCAAQEQGHTLNIKLADSYAEYSKMQSSNIYNTNPPFNKPARSKTNITYLMNKLYNLISKVSYDINKEKGDVITNISYIQKKYAEEAIEIMNNIYKKKPEYCVGNKYSIIEADNNKVGIVTLCSLTMDGILINHGITSKPEYSGVLDIYGNNKRFTELISYQGSSADPHEIFIKKNMQDIKSSLNDEGRILASVHTVPYIARDKTISIFELLADSGFNTLNIGKPNEYIYNARVEKYKFGYVLPGGLNLIAAIREQQIPVQVKSLETIMDYTKFEEL